MNVCKKSEESLQGAGEDDPRKADMLAADRYFSGDDDVGWERGAPPRPAPGSTATSPPEGVSSSTIVSGLVASRKQDHAVSLHNKGPALHSFPFCFLSYFLIFSLQWNLNPASKTLAKHWWLCLFLSDKLGTLSSFLA